jgi:glucosyl-dolichyl phosphate glucuronosyltransferase
MYVPDLIIYHYIHPDRLTKRYFRRWHFWRGVSSGVLDHRQPQPTPYLFGVPRYLFGSAARGLLHILPRMAGLRKDPAELFGNELKVFDLFGFLYGKHFYKPSNT